MSAFKNIKPEEIKDNAFKLIGSDWMLLTAGGKDSFNTMTASWGSMGVLWHKNVCTIFVRPERYTFDFIEKYETFSLCFFNETYRDALKKCGSLSGRDVNKVDETGLTAAFTSLETPYFEEAKLIIECKKLYFQDLDPENFLSKDISGNYANAGLHRLYIGEIISCMHTL